MELTRGLYNWPPTDSRYVATIGNFDGVHLGHQTIFEQLKIAAQEHQLPSLVISFQPLPNEYFRPEARQLRLQTLRERINCISDCGIDHFLLIPFNQKFASQSASTFVSETLLNKLKLRHLLIGDDFRFGADRKGDITLLQTFQSPDQFSVSRSATVEHRGSRVSSTRIREHLQCGECELAAELLGRKHRISGRVVHGEKIGRQLGFPTANVALKDHRPLLRGVFAVEAVRSDGQRYPAVANLGERPTVAGRQLLLEVHLLDQTPDLYGERLAVDFHQYIRGEKKFDSLDDLKTAIAADAETARQFFKRGV